MALRRKMIAANWKMDGGKQLAHDVLDNIKQLQPTAQVVICPPSVYLDSVQQLNASMNSDAKLGAQNLSQFESGAYTGELSGSMLKEFGCEYVIIGHSERRRMYGEASNIVAEKFAMAQKLGLTPILCVGEPLSAREENRTFEVIAEELDAVITHCGPEALSNAVIAYEPVWAIGTGLSATPEQAQEVHAFIRNRVKEASPVIGEKIQILYGGSVKASNAAELFAQKDVDGGLVGGASLNASEFTELCRIASETE